MWKRIPKHWLMRSASRVGRAVAVALCGNGLFDRVRATNIVALGPLEFEAFAYTDDFDEDAFAYTDDFNAFN